MPARIRHSLIGASIVAILIGAVLVVALYERMYHVDPPVPPTLFVQGDYPIDYIAYSSDGKTIVTTGAESGMVSVRDAQTGRLVRQWPGGGDQRWISQNGRLMLECSLGGAKPWLTKLRDLTNGKLLRKWQGKVKCVAVNFSYMLLLPKSASPSDKSAKYRVGSLVDLRTGKSVGHFKFYADAKHLCISNSGSWLTESVSNGPSQIVHLPDLTTKLSLPPMVDLRVDNRDSVAIGIAPNGTVHRWSLSTGTHTVVATGLRGTDCGYITSRCVLIHGQSAGTNGLENVLQVRCPDGSRLIKTVHGDVESFSNDGAFVAFASSDDSGAGRCTILDAASGATLAKLDSVVDSLGQTETGTDAQCVHYAVSPDGNRIAAACASGLIRLYDLRVPAKSPSGAVSLSPGRAVLAAATNGGGIIADVAVRPHGGVAAVGGDGSYRDAMRVSSWYPTTSPTDIEVGREIGFVERLGISPDGTTLAAASHLGLWTYNLQTRQDNMIPMPRGIYTASQAIGRPVWLAGPAGSISTVAEKQGRVIDWSVGAVRARPIAPDRESFAGVNYAIRQIEPFSDGRLTVVTWLAANLKPSIRGRTTSPTSGLMELRDTRTGQVIRRLDTSTLDWRSWANPNEDYRFAISPDQKTVAASTGNGRILLWSAATGRRIGMMTCSRCGTPMLASRYPRSALLAFSPDGRVLAAARYDGSIYLYSVRTHLPIAQIGQTVPLDANYARPLTWLGYDANGGFVYGTPLDDPRVLAWKVPPGAP